MFEWYVKNYDCNANVIRDYNVLSHKEDMIKKLRKKYRDKNYFEEELKTKMMSQYWGRAEYELLIHQVDDKIILSAWCGCSNPREVEIDVSTDLSFDWKGFVKEHNAVDNVAKIDIYDQLQYRWNEFVDYCWNYRFKYERRYI